nr:MAG TPA: hypothetical protein [Caudoviricetes sp.]
MGNGIRSFLVVFILLTNLLTSYSIYANYPRVNSFVVYWYIFLFFVAERSI